MNLKPKILFAALAMFIIGSLMLGLGGLSSTRSVSVGNCQQSYTHDVVKSFLRDFFECRNNALCGVHEALDLYNAKVGVIQCLCQRQEENQEAIISFYNQQLVASFIKEPQTSDNVDYICSEGAQPLEL